LGPFFWIRRLAGLPFMSVAIPPLQAADLPDRRLPFWRMTGPGAVLVGLSIGAGEIVVWPHITARFGSMMIWAAALGVFVQLWVNLEVGRWTIATGESSYTGFCRLWRFYAHIFIFLNVSGWLLPGWARTSGTALKALILGPDHGSPDWFWTGLTFVGVAVVLLGPRRVYVAVERTVGTLVVVVVLGLIFVAVRVGTWETVREFFRGLTGFRYAFDESFTIKDLFSAVVFAGAGGTANLFYAYYLRDKHIGMGGRIPMLLNPFRGRAEKAVQAGYVFSETEDNRRRFRDWFTFVALDQTLYFWLLNTFTIFLFIFGALAVLHPQGIVPQQGRLIYDEAAVLAESMGLFGRRLFLVIGVATLFSTQVTLVDGVARSMADIFSTSFAFGRRYSQAGWYIGVAIFIMVFGTWLTGVLEARGISDLGFLFNAAYMGGFAMALYTPLLLWMNLRHLPRLARPGPLNILMMVAASAVYVGFAVFCAIYEIQSRWGG